MHILKQVLTGSVVAIGIVTFSMAGTALAKVKKHEHETATPPAHSSEQEIRPTDLGGNDRQLQGRFYRSSRHHTHHKAKIANQ